MLQARLQWRGECLEQQLALRSPLRIGRDPRRCQLVIPAHWLPCSRLQAELFWDSDGWTVRDGVDGQPSANGSFGADGVAIDPMRRLGRVEALTLLFGAVPDDRVQLELSGLDDPLASASGGATQAAAPALAHIRPLAAGSGSSSSGAATPPTAPSSAADPSAVSARSIPSGLISIGRHPACTIQLHDPTVSRLHALLRPEGGGAALLEDRSSNGLFIAGVRASHLSRILPGADLRIGRSRLLWDGSRLSPLGEQRRFGLEVRDLSLHQRLRSLSLSIPGGQLVALVGGSGAGKSSLLTTLAGQNPGYSGRIQINGEDLRRSIAALRPLMGYVPQDDIVHRDLSVEEVLCFAARLRIPDREARMPAVERALELLELDHRRQALVRELSGGQRKRVNIGMELVADPRLLFLDEPTSGLDPGLERRMMRLLRQLADRGHTVLVVTHATANVSLCDQLVFLARGGRICYAGPPADCQPHFGLSGDFAEVYEALDRDEAQLEQISDAFQRSCVLPPLALATGNGAPGSAAGAMPSAADTSAPAPSVPASSTSTASIPASSSSPSVTPPSKPGELLQRPLRQGLLQPLRRFGSQLNTLFTRELLIARRDRVSLVLNLLTAPVAIALLAAAIQRPRVFHIPDAGLTAAELPLAIKVVFVISCACIWSGISSHISAVARERPIYERERSFNLLPAAYVAAKALMIVLLALPQALLVVLSVALLFQLPQPAGIGPALIGYCLAALLTILASGSMALFLSTLVRDPRQAGSSSPLLLMPQLILSGVLFEIGSLTLLYPLVASRWSVKLLGAYASLETLKLSSPVPGLPQVDVEPYLSTLDNVGLSVRMLLLQVVGFS
ncbi:MAG: ATP-binding cassette domain-containing protein, partial [Synechococcaceae cyanobacterium]|nr:ATP-binding cassette domain-containing protein [Synechococcaceae cyanobacterium]